MFKSHSYKLQVDLDNTAIAKTFFFKFEFIVFFIHKLKQKLLYIYPIIQFQNYFVEKEIMQKLQGGQKLFTELQNSTNALTCYCDHVLGIRELGRALCT